MATFIIGAIVFGLIFLIIFNMYRKSKKGEGCASGCGSCPSAQVCLRNNQSK